MNKHILAILIIVILLLGGGAGVTAWLRPGWLPFLTRKQQVPFERFTIAVNREPIEMEAGLEGHRDYPFHNQINKPITIALERTDCECASVLVCLAPESWQDLEEKELVKRSDDKALDWQTLREGGKGFLVPPGAKGLVRLTWKPPPTSGGEHVFWAGLFLSDDKGRGYRRVEAPLHLIEILRLRAEEDPNVRTVDVGSLKAGEERTARFVCYSQTRDHFSLTPTSTTDDPNIVYGAPQPFSDAEKKTLSTRTKTAVRSGYHLQVTIREKAGDARLDIGPFRRRIAWKTDVLADYPLATHVEGTVLGEVSLKTADGKAFIDLGTFLPSEVKPLIFTLESADEKLSLTVDKDKTIEFFKAELLDGTEGKKTAAGKSWRVRIQFDSASYFRGPFPNPDHPNYESAVVCSVVFIVTHGGGKTAAKEHSPRRLYVPLRGNARSF